ncbi:protein ANTI-SILENCING 1-like isoform X2 [Malania oleifera]|uniref:protein ANTI-SILENCING 1-like isoform X2 n=1 Tax=Malania oleifera TaxID=397392 RepID=UPI0025AE22BC|nr:protein ANTI-SILENCING 1-like isoform X2 [Malania oleifera]
MSHLNGAKDKDNLEFKWGIKKGIGGPHGDIQFYESFTFDGEEYFLYDCVYMFRENEPEPDIGKLVKIWETPSHTKRVKVVWFFRPIEIRNWSGDDEPLQNELFLACGEGTGLYNLNPLEAICGKCNVICASKDERNSQESKVELRMADFIFYRTFDVGSYTISDRFPDRIAGIKVEYYFNKKKDQNFGAQTKFNEKLKERTAKSISRLNFYTEAAATNAMKSGMSSTRSPLVKESKNAVASLGKQAHCPDENSALKAKTFTLRTGTGTGTGSPVEKNMRYKDSSPMSAPENRPPKKRKLLDSMSLEIQSNALLDPGEGSDPKTLWVPKNASKEELIKGLPASQNRGLSTGFIHGNVSRISNQAVSQTEQNKDRKKWFKPPPWDERMQNAQRQGTLVLLENLDPSSTSSEVEDIVSCAFNEKVVARVIERTTFCSPHYGQAFAIFRSKDKADLAISELKRRCLILTSGRPVIGSRVSPREPTKPTAYAGHLIINRFKHLKQREEMRNAVSTSHYAQPNTIEYEMAMDWRILQEKSDIWWNKLHEQQANEIEVVRSQRKDLI